MRIVSVLFAASMSATLLAQAPSLKPGRYELVSEFAMAGRSTGLPPQKMEHCYTPQELQDLASNLARRDPKQSCKIQDSKMSGSTLTYTTECSNADGSQLTLSGQVNFTSQESFHAVVNMKSSGAGSPFANGMTTNVTAKRVGECSK